MLALGRSLAGRLCLPQEYAYEAVIEFDRRSWLVGLMHHYTPSEFIKRELEQAGYALRQEFDFLDRQSFLIFSPK